jgi:SAM-dependent methyltransferase
MAERPTSNPAATSLKTTDEAASVEWQEASADKLPFPDDLFDVAYCQLGLQFFADRPAALREMRRVLSTKGRLAVMVWCGIHESPGFEAFAEILERNVSPTAGSIMRAPFGLSDANELSRLIGAAGFLDIAVQRTVGAVEFPSAERFVLSYVAGSPLASHVSQASDVARQNLIADTKLALEKYVGSRGLSFRSPLICSRQRSRVRYPLLALRIIACKRNEQVALGTRRTKRDQLNAAFADTMLCTKFESWKYEREKRMLVPLSKATREGRLYFVSFGDELALAEVILGPLCSLNVKEVHGVVERLHKDVTTFQARLAFNTFHVVPKESTVA